MKQRMPGERGPKPLSAHEAKNDLWYILDDGQYVLPDPRNAEEVGAFITPSGHMYKVTGWDDKVEPGGLTFEKIGKYDPNDVEEIVLHGQAVLAKRIDKAQ